MSKWQNYSRERIITDLLTKIFQLMGTDKELSGTLKVNDRSYIFNIRSSND